MDALILLGIGIIIGWHVPVPPWATVAINFVKGLFKEFVNKP